MLFPYFSRGKIIDIRKVKFLVYFWNLVLFFDNYAAKSEIKASMARAMCNFFPLDKRSIPYFSI